MMEKEMSKFFDGEMIRHFEEEVFKLGQKNINNNLMKIKNIDKNTKKI